VCGCSDSKIGSQRPPGEAVKSYAWNGKSRWLAFEQLLSARPNENCQLSFASLEQR
jgi:hypothetical protein